MKNTKLKKTLRIDGIFLRDKTSFFLICMVFLFQTIFFSLSIKQGVSPDENYHVKLSQLYSGTLLSPSNSENSFHLGQIEDIPFLYHWVSSRVLNLKNIIFPDIENFITLRLFSIIISVLNLFLAYKIVKELTEDKLKHILVMFMLANTLMFVFLSASVGYDPLVLLFSFLSIFLVLKLLKRNSLIFLLLLIISLLAGMLTKISFLPIVLVIGGFIIIHVFKGEERYIEEIRDSLKRKKKLKYLIPLLIIMCFFLFLSLNLYLGNIIKYKSLTPSCTQVMTEENCMKSGEFSSYSEIHENAPPREERVEPYWYVPHWMYLMIDRTYGIFGHKKMVLSYGQFANYFTIIILGMILFIRKYDIKNSKQTFLIVLSLSYIFILMFYTNYQAYLSHGLLHAAVQGRYIFPVIVPIYIFIVYGLMSFKNKYIRGVIFGAVLFIFLYGNIPFFIKNLTEDWFVENSWGTYLILNTRNLVYTANHYLRNLLH